MTEVPALLQQFTTRYRNALLAKSGVLAALGFGVVGALAWRLHAMHLPAPPAGGTQAGLGPVWSLGIPAALVLVLAVGLAWWLRRRWIPRHDAAHYLDQALGLQQRLMTAAEFAGVTPTPTLYPLLVEETTRHLSSIERVRVPRPLDHTAGALALILLVLLWWPGGAHRPLQLAQLPSAHPPTPPPNIPAPPPPHDSTQQQDTSGAKQTPNSQQTGQGTPSQPSGGGQSAQPPRSGDQSQSHGGSNQSGGGQSQAGTGSSGQDRGQGRDTSRQDQAGSQGQRASSDTSASSATSDHRAEAQTSPRGGAGQDQSSARGNERQRDHSSRRAAEGIQRSASQAQGSKGQEANRPQAGQAPGQQPEQAPRQGSGQAGQENRPSKQGDLASQHSGQPGASRAQPSAGRMGREGGFSAGDQEAIKADIQQLLKEVSGELKELEAQLAAAKDQPHPEAGTGTSPELYGPATKLDRATGSPVPIQLQTDTVGTKSPRPGSGVGKPSGEVSGAAPTAQAEDAQLSSEPLEETPSDRQPVPPEYREAFDRIRQQQAQPKETKP